MKKAFIIGLMFLVFPALVKANGSIEDNLMSETFVGMFDSGPIYYDLSIENDPPPPVPLDGGLTAILLAGSIAGYRHYKNKRA